MLSGTVESVSFDGTVAVIFLEGGACIALTAGWRATSGQVMKSSTRIGRSSAAKRQQRPGAARREKSA